MNNQQRLLRRAADEIAAEAFTAAQTVAEFCQNRRTITFLAQGAYRTDETVQNEMTITPEMITKAEQQFQRIVNGTADLPH